MDLFSPQIEPKDSCIHNLIAAKTSVKSTVEDKGKIGVFCVSNDLGHLIVLEPVFASGGSTFRYLKIFENIGSDVAFFTKNFSKVFTSRA